ncbi:MAG: hypothetical protein PHF81_07290 [Flavobacterium sp.]|nr:hypothetical protein [Flavobacterium sp.]
MNINNKFWNNLDNVVQRHNEHILSDEQRKLIADEEQKAYEANIEKIKEIIEEVDNELKERGFWTETYVDKKGFRFRFNKSGYYGPGGFSSQYHMGGPLVLGIINPAGDSLASYYKNNLEENIQIGCNFDKSEFSEFVKKTIMDFISPNNLIISKDQYDNLRNFKADN